MFLTPLAAFPRIVDVVSVDLNEVDFSERLALYKHSLIALVVLAKGEKPWILSDLKSKLSKFWTLSSWKYISMSKGYFQVLFHSESDKNRIWALGSLYLKPSILRL